MGSCSISGQQKEKGNMLGVVELEHISDGETMVVKENMNKDKAIESDCDNKKNKQKAKDVGIKLRSSTRAPSKPIRMNI